MKQTFEVTMIVEVEIEDGTLSAILPEFNEAIFDTDEEGLLSHIATMTAREFDFIEGVGRVGIDFKATVTNIETEVA